MSTREGRGGYRQPANPAAVSNPQSGARTDGGAGSQEQPLRVPTGGAYGQRQAAVQQQQGAPLAAGGAAPGPGGAGPGPTLPPEMAGGVFGPTASPGGPGGVPPSPLAAEDPQMYIRVLASKFPHPAIRRLVDWSAARDMPTRGTQPVSQGPPTTIEGRAAVPPPRSPVGVPTSPTPPTGPGVTTAEEMPSSIEAIEQGP